MPKKTLVLIFIIFHLFSTAVWNLKGHIEIPEPIVSIAKPYMYGLSLWQDWGVFSPNPYLKEISTRIVIEAGNKTAIYYHKYAEDGMPLVFNRLRKFNDNLVSKKNPGLSNAYLVYLCKEFRNIYKPGYASNTISYAISLEIVYKDIPFPARKYEPSESYEKIGEITCS